MSGFAHILGEIQQQHGDTLIYVYIGEVNFAEDGWLRCVCVGGQKSCLSCFFIHDKNQHMHKSALRAVPEQHFPLKLSHMDKPQEVLRARTSRKQSACQMRLLNDV